MKLSLDTRMYTNFILTAIAVLLLLITLNFYRVQVSSAAIAQTTGDSPSQASQGARFSRPGRNAPVDVSNVAQTQDTAVAAATNNVAEANRDIAAAIRELVTGIKGINLAPATQGTANATLGATATNTSRPEPPADATKPVIEMSPSQSPTGGNR
ncbi:MAG: hypothetical protein ACR2IE_08580 [Candidatus Sumerlaeaceae bacterium]